MLEARPICPWMYRMRHGKLEIARLSRPILAVTQLQPSPETPMHGENPAPPAAAFVLVRSPDVTSNARKERQTLGQASHRQTGVLAVITSLAEALPSSWGCGQRSK